MQILMNGDIAVCSCRVSPELVTDNIFNHKDLMDYWRGGKIKKFREDWLNGKIPGICRGCNHYLPVSLTGKFLLKDKLKKLSKKILIQG
jgi:radical SAM protein with 4Fe4S-binding SPASM domain